MPIQGNLEPDKTNENQDLFHQSSTNESIHLDTPNSGELSHPPDTLGLGKADESQDPDVDGDLGGNSRQRYTSLRELMAAHRARVVPELREEDLDETFVRGSGPGGQAINKTSSSVSLIHRPTGIRVQCQATRSREQNRKIARKIMLEKLDEVANPELSKLEVQREKVREKKRRRAKKAKKKARSRTEPDSAAQDPEGSS